MAAENKKAQRYPDHIEALAGKFDKTYPYVDKKGKKHPAQDIAYANKPAQQLLTQLGCPPAKNPGMQLLSQIANKQNSPLPFTTDVQITDAFPSGGLFSGFGGKAGPTLSITKEVLQSCAESAKLYLHKSVFKDTAAYEEAAKAQLDFKRADEATNQAAGVVHAQKIHLLVEYEKDETGTAVFSAKQGKIQAGKEILLLSSPALNCGYDAKTPPGPGPASHLSTKERKKYITALYENLFSAALAEGYRYIALPPAGLGVFMGDPDEYFEVLTQVSAQFPELNIYYNPAQHGVKFNQALQDARHAGNALPHLKATDKDVVHLAAVLTENGYPCALHNPSDAAVVYGHADIGMFWKQGRGANYVGEENIGAISTGILGSKGINPGAYSKKRMVFLNPPSYEAALAAPADHNIAIPSYEDATTLPPYRAEAAAAPSAQDIALPPYAEAVEDDEKMSAPPERRSLMDFLQEDAMQLGIVDIALVKEARAGRSGSQWQLVFQDQESANRFETHNKAHAGEEKFIFHRDPNTNTFKLGPGNADMFMQDYCPHLCMQYGRQSLYDFAYDSCKTDQIRLEEIQQEAEKALQTQLVSLQERVSAYHSAKSHSFDFFNENKSAKVATALELESILKSAIESLNKDPSLSPHLMRMMQIALKELQEGGKHTQAIETKGQCKELFNEILILSKKHAASAQVERKVMEIPPSA